MANQFGLVMMMVVEVMKEETNEFRACKEGNFRN